MQALYDGDANNIKAWLLKCPRNQITTLDTHDGLGVVDVADLMSQEQIERTKSNIFERGANANMRFNSEEYGNLDTYQVRRSCSFSSSRCNYKPLVENQKKNFSA
jgi:sucrose phosphorylase